eukprot:g51530.t1
MAYSGLSYYWFWISLFVILIFKYHLIILRLFRIYPKKRRIGLMQLSCLPSNVSNEIKYHQDLPPRDWMWNCLVPGSA